MIEFNPYPYQERVADCILLGKSVILQAPTGAGKTAAALLPFIHATQYLTSSSFPRQCVYSVPMRVLANQFEAEYKKLARRSGLTDSLTVTIQTGERPDDPEVKGDLVFTTIDQTLSNVLGVPYAFGSGRANLNAGAVIGSYLVFDEFHLYPPDGALKTTLQILTLLKNITPFVLMTATFSTTMLDQLKQLLDAEVITVPPDELKQIPSQQKKTRGYHIVNNQLTASAVLESHKRRSIAICNTVERAQELYQDLSRPKSDDIGVVLLHARFTATDRKKKEEFIQDQFGKDKTKWSAPSVILVATQVIEVGLDITCENLHTEIAPANAVFQRAGRCARFENEQGEVFIYNVELNKKGERNFSPYKGKEARLCENAWNAFLARDRYVLDFPGEQQVIDEVHTEADRELLNSMRAGEREIWDMMQRAMTQNDSRTRRDLIRDSSDSRTLLVHDQPEMLDNPFRYRGFSLYIGTLLGKYDELEEWRQEKELDWVFKFPEEAKESEKDSRTAVEYKWHLVRDKDDLKYFPLFVVHPAVVKYDEKVGFRFSPNGNADPNRLNESASRPRRSSEFIYQLESYPDHIHAMTRAFESKWRDRIQFAATRLEQVRGWQSKSIERAARLAIACHDLGKLDVRWQRWAREYQAKIGEPVTDPNLMIVHTHNETEAHRQAEKGVRLKRPHHAAEGAIAVAKLVNGYFSEGREALRKVTLTSIARHHSAQTNTFDEKYELEKAAPEALYEALQNAGTGIHREVMNGLLLRAPKTQLEKQILGGGEAGEWWLAYFLLVRALRLCDEESQEGG